MDHTEASHGPPWDSWWPIIKKKKISTMDHPIIPDSPYKDSQWPILRLPMAPPRLLMAPLRLPMACPEISDGPPWDSRWPNLRLLLAHPETSVGPSWGYRLSTLRHLMALLETLHGPPSDSQQAVHQLEVDCVYGTQCNTVAFCSFTSSSVLTNPHTLDINYPLSI